jgi:hypothetical protein
VNEVDAALRAYRAARDERDAAERRLGAARAALAAANGREPDDPGHRFGQVVALVPDGEHWIVADADDARGVATLSPRFRPTIQVPLEVLRTARVVDAEARHPPCDGACRARADAAVREERAAVDQLLAKRQERCLCRGLMARPCLACREITSVRGALAARAEIAPPSGGP